MLLEQGEQEEQMDPSFIIHLGILSSIWGDGCRCKTDTREENISTLVHSQRYHENGGYSGGKLPRVAEISSIKTIFLKTRIQGKYAKSQKHFSYHFHQFTSLYI